MPRSFLGRLATVIKLCSLLWRWYCMDQFYPQLYLALYRTRDQAPGLMGQFRKIVAASPGDRWPVGEILRDQDVDRFPVLEDRSLPVRQKAGGREVDADVQFVVVLLVIQIHGQGAAACPGDGTQRLKGLSLPFRQRLRRYGAHPKVRGTETVAAAPKTPVHRLVTGSADAGPA